MHSNPFFLFDPADFFDSQKIGQGWITDLYQLKKILPFAKKQDFIEAVQDVKKVRISQIL